MSVQDRTAWQDCGLPAILWMGGVCREEGNGCCGLGREAACVLFMLSSIVPSTRPAGSRAEMVASVPQDSNKVVRKARGRRGRFCLLTGLTHGCNLSAH